MGKKIRIGGAQEKRRREREREREREGAEGGERKDGVRGVASVERRRALRERQRDSGGRREPWHARKAFEEHQGAGTLGERGRDPTKLPRDTRDERHGRDHARGNAEAKHLRQQAIREMSPREGHLAWNKGRRKAWRRSANGATRTGSKAPGSQSGGQP